MEVKLRDRGAVQNLYKIYIKLNNVMGAGMDCKEFSFVNAYTENFGDGYLNVFDAEGLRFRCKMSEVERFVRFN